MSQHDSEGSTPQQSPPAPASTPRSDAEQGKEATDDDGGNEQSAETQAERRHHRLTGTVFMLLDDTE